MNAAGYVLLVHGGAGRAPRLADFAARAEAGMRSAAEAGEAVLDAGGSARSAVVAAVRELEASPVFNAGLGSVANSDGDVEMDAAVMRGQDARAGAVAGLRVTKHPVEAAQAVLEAGVSTCSTRARGPCASLGRPGSSTIDPDRRSGPRCPSPVPK